MKSTDWQVVQQLLVDKTGEKLGRLEAIPVSGGDINRAYRLSDGQHQFFIKINNRERLPMFEAELHGLDEIRRSNTIRAPRAIACGITGSKAFIVMEYLELSGRPDPAHLARQLTSMHLCTRDQFGFVIDNTIGSTPQVNGFSPDWVGFWQQNRLGYQLSLVKNNAYDKGLFDAGMRLNEQVSSFFSDYMPVASLLHGDLWGGNQGADSAGNPVIYDPACYYGRFFSAYREVFPIDDGYPVRRELYNLYHILNHAYLFGGGYEAQARRMVDHLLSQL